MAHRPDLPSRPQLPSASAFGLLHGALHHYMDLKCPIFQQSPGHGAPLSPCRHRAVLTLASRRAPLTKGDGARWDCQTELPGPRRDTGTEPLQSTLLPDPCAAAPDRLVLPSPPEPPWEPAERPFWKLPVPLPPAAGFTGHGTGRLRGPMAGNRPAVCWEAWG